MIETTTRHIDGYVFETSQFPARRAFKYQTRLIKILAPLAGLLGNVKIGDTQKKSKINSHKVNKESDVDSLLDKDIDFSKLGDFAISLDEEKTMDFVMELLSTTRIDDKEITESVFDLEFAGRIDLVYKVLIFVLEANYKSFFVNGGIGKILSKVNKQ